jgi:hypothetical protein
MKNDLLPSLSTKEGPDGYRDEPKSEEARFCHNCSRYLSGQHARLPKLVQSRQVDSSAIAWILNVHILSVERSRTNNSQ